MIEFIRNGYKKRSLQWMISLSFTAISMISIVAMAIAFYSHSINTIRENTIKENEQIVDQVSWNLNSYIRNMMGISDTMYYSVIKNTNLTNEKINK